MKENWQISAPKNSVEKKANEKVQKSNKVKTDWKRKKQREQVEFANEVR